MTMPVSVKKKDGGKIPGPANVGNVIEIAMSFQLPNQKLARNVVHGFFTTAPANMQTLANNLFTSLASSWATNLAPHMHAQTTFQNVQIRDMTSFTNPIFVSVGTPQAGTGSAAAMPTEAAIVLTEEIVSRGKGLKGRIYLCGWDTSADAGAGLISSTVQVAVNAFGTSILTALQAQNLTACVAQVARQQYQGITGTIHPARPANHVNVSSYVCKDLQWDTQRRRGLA